MGHVYLSFSKGSNREADKQLELHRVVTEHPGVAGPPALDLASWERQNPSSHLGPLHLHLPSEQKPRQGASGFTALGDYILSGLWAPVGSKNEDMASLCSVALRHPVYISMCYMNRGTPPSSVLRTGLPIPNRLGPGQSRKEGLAMVFDQ